MQGSVHPGLGDGLFLAAPSHNLNQFDISLVNQTRCKIHVLKKVEQAYQKCTKCNYGHEISLAQVMAWCRQAASHYHSQCWPRFMTPRYGITRAHWGNQIAARILQAKVGFHGSPKRESGKPKIASLLQEYLREVARRYVQSAGQGNSHVGLNFSRNIFQSFLWDMHTSRTTHWTSE